MMPKKQIREGDVDEVNLQLRKLEILGTLQQLVMSICMYVCVNDYTHIFTYKHIHM